MHCRPCYGTNIPKCTSSFCVTYPGYIPNSNYQTYTSPLHHQYDQTLPPSLPPPRPPPSVPRHRRRLEDPIITYASNYYSTVPHQMSPPSPPPPLPPRRIYQPPSDRNGIYCDLYNLLERPSPQSPPSINQRRKYNSNDYSSRHFHRPTDFENVHTKMKNTNDRKSHHKEKRQHNDKLSLVEQYDRSPEKTKRNNHIYQRRSSNKGFFRRLVHNYFCMPSTFTNNGYSS